MDSTSYKRTLLGLTLDQLTEAAQAIGMPRYAGKQLAEWLYVKRAKAFDDMTNISKKFRALLEQNYEVGRFEPIERMVSSDGTIKYLFPAADRFVETVYIPDGDRATLCVSSQVGCRMNCLFCQTGKQGFSGHLTSGEIMNQILSIPESEQLTNIVYMGMGEPMDNIEQVLQSVKCLTSDYGLAWSPKRITVSTIGVEPGLSRFLKESNAHLAVSLHSARPDERRKIMPVQGGVPIHDVVEKIKEYNFSGQRRVTFEYIVFTGLNDSRRDVQAIVQLIGDLPCRINLIRYHRIPEIDLPSTTEASIKKVQEELLNRGLQTTIRASRGEDIMAACGMLSTLKMAASQRIDDKS